MSLAARLISISFAFLVRRVLAAVSAELVELEPLGALPAVLRRAVIPPFALGARQGDDFTHQRDPCMCDAARW